MAVTRQSIQHSVEVFAQFNTDQIQEWTKHVWDNDFDNVDPPPPEFEEALRDTSWISLLDDARLACKEWAEVKKNVENEGNGESREAENGFWSSLVENEIDIKSVIAICFWFMKNGQEKCSPFASKEAACYSSALYSGLLLIPGSSAFFVFHPVVFEMGVDVYKMITLHKIFNDSHLSNGSGCASGKRGRAKTSEDRNSRNNARKKRLKRNQSSKDSKCDADDLLEDSENDMDVENYLNNDEFQSDLTPQNISILAERIHLAIGYLVKVLRSFSLRRYEQSMMHAIHALSELSRLNENNFAFTGRNRQTLSFCSLAYKGLMNICTPLHGDVTKIHLQIMKNLLPNILTLQNNVMNSRDQNTIKENTSKFIIDLLNTYGDEMHTGIVAFLQHVCVNVLDKAECRSKIALFLGMLLSKLPLPLYVKCIKWLKKFVLHSKVNNRMLGIEIFACMLSEKERKIDENVSQNLLLYISHKYLLSFIVSRCCDKASSVRAKALSILAVQSTSTISSETNVLKELLIDAKKLKKSASDQTNITNGTNKTAVVSETGDASECIAENGPNCSLKISNAGDAATEVGINSDRASKVIEEVNDAASQCTFVNNEKIIELICRRCNDDKVHTRKAALQVLENILKLLPRLITEKNVSIIAEHCLDPALLARKQAVQSMYELLITFPESPLLQCKWVEGVLPVIYDSENSCQEKCMESVESIIFSNLVQYSRSNSSHHQMAWKILTLISKEEYYDYQQYLQKICLLWAKTGKLKVNTINILQSHIETENNDATWLLLSQLLPHIQLKDYSFVLDYWINSSVTNENQTSLQKVIQIIGYTSKGTSQEKILQIVNNLKECLRQFSSTSIFIPMIFKSLKKLLILINENEAAAELEMSNFCIELIKICDKILSNAVLNQKAGSEVTEDEVVHYVQLLGEIALRCPSTITKRINLLIPSFVAAPVITESDTDPFNYILSSQPSTQGSTQPSSQSSQPLSQQNIFKTSANMSPKIRAHAVITLGKLCLQDEKLAKSCVPALAKELDAPNEIIIRNNIIIVLCDLCKRYTGLIDMFVTRIAACLKDPSVTIAQQTLILLTQLLQEDYIKWKGSLYYHYITLLVDENPNIRQMTEYCLVHTLLQRNPTKLYHHFLECIFHFNCYEHHPTYNKFPQSEREIQLFSLKGDGKNQEKRLKLYKFLLEKMADEHRFQITAKIVQDILGAIVDGIIELDADSENLLQDSLTILICDEIKLSTLRSVPQDEVEEGDLAAVVAATKKTIISQVVKKNVIENIVPVVISLKHLLEKKKSPLLRELMMFLKDLMKDYKNEIKDILAADAQLANEIEFDLNRFSQEQEEEERRNQERLKNRGTDGRLSVRSSPLLHLSKTSKGKPLEGSFLNRSKTCVTRSANPLSSHSQNQTPIKRTNSVSQESPKSDERRAHLKENSVNAAKTEPISPPPEAKLSSAKTNVTPVLCRSLANLELLNETPVRAVSTPAQRISRLSFHTNTHGLQLSPIIDKMIEDDHENEKMILYLPPPT